MNKREFIQKFGLVGLATYSLPGDIIYDKNKFNLPPLRLKMICGNRKRSLLPKTRLYKFRKRLL